MRVACVAVGEGVEVPRARDHRAAGKLDHPQAFAGPEHANGARRVANLFAQARPAAPQRPPAEHRRRGGVPGERSTRRVPPRNELAARIQAVVERLARERTPGIASDRAHEERRIGRAPAQGIERRVARRLPLAQPLRLGGRDDERQGTRDVVLGVAVVAVQAELRRPAVREPACRRPEEAIADRRPRDPAARERVAVPSQVRAAREAPEHAVDPRRHARIVRVGAQEAQQLVQALDPAGGAQPRRSSTRSAASLRAALSPPYPFLIRSRAASARTAVLNVSSSP
jgi:hypothetical protein